MRCIILCYHWLILTHYLVSVFRRPLAVATVLFGAIKSKAVSRKLKNWISSAYHERHGTKQLLEAQEILFPDLYHSLLTALNRLMARDWVGLEWSKMKRRNYKDWRKDFLWQKPNASLLPSLEIVVILGQEVICRTQAWIERISILLFFFPFYHRLRWIELNWIEF